MMHDTIVADPDLLQSIEDLRETVADLLRQSKVLLGLKNPAHRQSQQAYLDDLTSIVALKAERHDLTAEAMIELVKADLDGQGRKAKGQTPRASGRTLHESYLARLATETEARKAVNAARIALSAATAARQAAEDAYQAHAAGRRI